MITFFAIPKAFEDRSDRIQRNAVRSWLQLGDDVDVILFGDDPGVAEAAAELGIEHIAEIGRTDVGTPTLDGAFAVAEARARTPLLCYINADIVLLADFREAAERLNAEHNRFLAVGASWDAA